MAPTDGVPSDASSPATQPHAERYAFLARAGEVLSSSLDLDRTLQEIARLAVPVLGDLCIVDIIENAGLRRVATAHVRPDKAGLLQALRTRYPTTRSSPHPAGRVMATGAPELIAQVTPEIVATHTADEEHASLIGAIGIRSHLAVPLVARGSTLGVISLGITESERTYVPEDIPWVEDIARRAALAIDNARLYELAQRELAERRRIEEELRLSEERYRAIVDQSPLSTQILAPDGRTIRVNRAWERLWGFTLDQLAGYNILEDTQLEGPGTAALLRRAFAGEPVDLPAIRYDPNEAIPDGSQYSDPARWVRAFAYPVKDDHGTVREVVLVHEDVTESRRREEALRSSEERLRLALAASRMNVWDWDLSTDIVSCSENAREFWGIEIGKASDFMAVIHPDDVSRVEQAGRVSLEAGDRYFSEYRLRHSQGRVRWVQSRGRVERDPGTGRAVRILGVTVDVTELKEAEERTSLLADAGTMLGASLDYRTTLQSVARLVVPRLADWCAVDLLTESGTLERVAVHHQDEGRMAAARHIFSRFPPRPEDPHGSWRIIRTRQPEWIAEIDADILESAAQGPEHLALLRGLELRSFIAVPLIARDEPIGVLSLAYAESGRLYRQSDLELATDLARRAAAAVDNAQLYQRLRVEDRRKDEFLATLAHELRNPLAPVRTGLALLRPDAPAAIIERTRQVMERQIEHMVRLIDDLLDLSRVTRGTIQLQKEQTDLFSILGTSIETSRPMLDAAGVQFTLRVPEEPIAIEADRTRVAQVISNILNNAAKFTPPGGRVELSAAAHGDTLLMRIEDDGVGIAAEMLPQVFEMFVQVRDARVGGQPGLGIGLTLVKRLVELHGGQVWAESRGIGQGSTFCISLPLTPGRSAAPPEMPAAASRATPPRRVLVVDDNLDAAEMLAALLALSGHDVRTAANGADALEMARTFRPDVALLDLGLPGMSGYELGQRLRLEPGLRNMRMIAITGWGQAEDRRRSREAGFDDHLTKPVEPDAVLAVIGAN